jgi:hypothetical protein
MRTVQNRDAEVERAVLSYVAAWNESDPDKLVALLQESWAEQGMVVSNYETLLGRRALHDRILRFRRDNSGTRTLLTSGIEQHHDFFRFSIVTVKSDGRCYSPALNIGELDASGQIDRIVTFFHELPAPPPQWPEQLVRREPLI